MVRGHDLVVIGICTLLGAGCYVSHPGTGIDPGDSGTRPDGSTDAPFIDGRVDTSVPPLDGDVDSDIRPDARPDSGPSDGRVDSARDTAIDVPPPIDAGRPSRALGFERGDRVFVTPSVTLDITSSHTYELWMRPRADGFALHKGETGEEGRYQYLVEVRGSTVVVGWATEVGEALVRGPIRTGVWNHISVVIEADAMVATLTLYVDGVEAGSGVFPNTLFDAINDQPLLMGGFTGDIDEVRLFTFARTGPAIRSTMRNRLRPPPPGMEAYWPLEESGQIALDRSLRGNEGVLGDFTFPDAADPTWIDDGPIP